MLYLIIITLIIIAIAEFKNTQTGPYIKTIDTQLARIRCAGIDNKNFDYENILECKEAYERFGSNQKCKEGCVGLYSCVRACPEGAIKKDLTIDVDKCNGCGVCVETCPQNLIALSSRSEKIHIGCATSVAPENIKEVCKNGCVKCYVCLTACNNRAISVDRKGMPVVDYLLCINCMKCAMKCPVGVIKNI
jgi:electron transport complex protein RnfB